MGTTETSRQVGEMVARGGDFHVRAVCRRSRIASHLWKTTALTTLALGLSGVVAHADPDGLWQPQIRAIVGADNNGGNAALEGFIPIKQTAESVLFLDVRAKHDFKDASGQDIGLGIRRIVNPDLMLGGYAYINVENYNSTQFTAGTLGVEAITPNFDAHVNVFVPIKGDSTEQTTSSTLSMVSNQLIEQVSVLDHRDYAAWGIEGEIGAKVPVNLPENHSLRVDIGGYHFEDPHGDDGSVTGAKAGFEYTIGDVFGSGTELVFAGEVRNDNRDDTQFAGSVRLNIPFNPGRGSDTTAAIGGAEPVYPVSEGLRKRVNERVRGDIGVRIQSQEIDGGTFTRAAVNAATNAAFGKFYFADGGLAGAGTLADPTTLDDAVTKAGSGGFIVALGGNGNIQTPGQTLAAGQTLIGGGENVTAKLFGGGTATFNLGGSDGTIQGTNVANNVITLGTGNTLNGVTITGGANGIFGNNATGTTLTNVTVTGAGGNGAEFTGNSTNVSASNFTATGNGLDGLHIEDNGTYNFTGTTLLSGNLDDGLDITGQGTYTFATVNALDNTDRGITVQGTSIAGSFTTTGGTVSGNGGMAVFIDPITAHVVLDSITQSGGTQGVHLDQVSGSFTVNGATTISNTSGPAISVSDSPATVRFGDIAITNPGSDGIKFNGVNAAVVAGNIVISGLGVGTGLDFSLSRTNFTAQSLNITGTGAAGSIGIDLSSPTIGAGATIIITNGGVIANVDTGVRFGISGSLANSANAQFSFGGGSIAGITASLDARGLNQTLGLYAFGSTEFIGDQLFDPQNVIFVGSTAMGSGDGSSLANLASVTTANANTDSDAIFVLVNDGTPIDASGGFSLSDGQTLASFGNGRSFSLGGIPVNVTGDNVEHGVTVSDPGGGAATLTSSAGADTVTLANNTSLLDFNVSNANPGGGTGIHGNNVTGVTISGVNVSGAGLDGLLFEGASNVAANNVTSTGNAGNGLHIDGDGNYAFTGTTTLTDNGGNGLLITGDGTYAFQTLNASDNSGFGVNVASTTGTFSTTGGTISGNGAAGVALLGGNIDVTLTSLTQDGGLFGATFAGVSGSFAVSGATTVSNTFLGGLGIFDSTADFTFGAVDISDITAPGGIGIDVQNSSGAVTFGGAVTLTHIDSEGILAIDNAGTLTFSGPVSMTDPGSGIWLEDNTGGVSFSGAVTIDQPFGNGIDVVGSNGIISFGDIDITGLCNCSTALDMSGSTSTFTAATLDVSGSSGGSSIGIDLSGTNGGSVTIGTGIITGVDTGVQLGTNGLAGTTANTTFSFGAAGGAVITGTTASLDMRGLLPGSGTYAFNTTVLNGPQLFDIANVIFVGAASTNAGDGSSVNDLINATAADALAAPANTVFVLVNNGAGDIDTDADGFTLSDGQSIVSFANGASVSLGGPPANVTGTHVISGTQFQSDPFGNGAATLNNSAGNTIDLANGNLVANLTVSSSATAIDGTGIAGATINGVTVGSAATGLVLDSVTGTVSVNGLHIQNASQTGIALVNSSAIVNFTGNTTITNAANVGLSANNFDGTAAFDDLDVSGGGIGVGIVAGSSGTLTFGAGSSIAGTSSNAFSITNSTPNVTYNGTISQTSAASAVTISNMTGGTATFGGKITASTGAANAIDLTGNAGGAINFTGGLDLTTDGGFGVRAVNGGTLTVTGSSNTVSTGAGSTEMGIQLGGASGLTIGAAGVTFSSVTVDGSGGIVPTGILIENTSGGNITFGGVNISRVSGDAIRLTNVANTVAFNGTTTIATVVGNGPGFVVQNSAATVNVANLVTTLVSGADVSLANNTGTIGIGGTITNSGSGDGVAISGGSAAITVSAAISSSAGTPGTAAKVDGITGGSVAFTGPINSTGTGTGVSVSNTVAGSSVSFGSVTVSGASGNGIDISGNAGSVTFTGTTGVTLGSAANAAGINFSGTNANVTFGTTNVTMGAGTDQTGIDFSGSSTTAGFGVTAITGTGILTSRGIDLSSTTGNKTITFQRGSSITNLGIGVDLARDLTTATSANANFTLGDGTSADGLQSSISATAVGAFTVNTVGLNPALGNYDFDDVTFTGNANLPSAVGVVTFVSQSGGVIAAGTDGLSKSVNTISVAAADALAGTETFAFVGTVDLSGTPFTLASGQSIDGFGNNNAITVSGTIQPVNVQGHLGATGGNVTGNEGVVTGTGDFLHLLGSNTVLNTAFDFSGASGSVFLVDQNAGGFNNAGGITIQGVTVSNVAAGSTAFKVADLDSNLSILDNNINVAGTLLDADGGAGTITVTRGNLPNSGPAGTLNGGSINLQNLTGTVTIGDGTLTNTGAGTTFNVGSTTAGSGGSADISYAGTINTNGTGAAVSIQNMTGGSVTLSGNLTDNNAAAGGNIVIAGNDSATITFSGSSKVISSGATDGVNIGWPGGVMSGIPDPNTNSAINFTGGGLDITTTGGMGFFAFGDFPSTNTMTVTGTGNKINSGAEGLVVSGTDVAAGGITFDSIVAHSTTNGAGVYLSGMTLAGDVNIGGLKDTGYIGASLSALFGTGVVNFTGNTDLDTSNEGFEISGQVGTINIANVAGSTLTIDGSQVGIAFAVLQTGTVNVGGNGGVASIGATTSTTGSAIALSGGNDLINATLNYNGSIKVDTGSVLQASGDWTHLSMSGSVVSTTASTAFDFFGHADGIYNIASTIDHSGGKGVSIGGSANGTVTFSGISKVFNTGANDAIVKAPAYQPDPQTEGTLDFTNGGLVITTTSGAGFTASTFGPGTISVTGTGNSITTGTGTALKLGDATAVVAGATGATVGSGGIKFDSISVNGAATGISLNDVSGSGTLDLGAVNLLGITGANARGVDISGTFGSTLSFDSLNVVIAASATNAVGLDLNGAALGASTITAGDFDVDGGSSVGSIGIDMAGTTGTGTIQLGDTVNNNPGPVGQTSTIKNVGYGVQFSSATNAQLVFGDGQGPAESSIATTGGQVIHATDSLPTNGDYNFNDVNFTGDTSNLASISVYYVTAGGTGDGSLANPGSYVGAQASTANVVVLIDQNVNGSQETIDLSGTTFNLDDGQVLLAFKSGDAAVDVSQLGVDASGGASAAFHFTTIQNTSIVSAPVGIDTLRPVLESNNATSVINFATSGTGTFTGGIANLIVRNTGSGAGVSLATNAAGASSFFLRDNDIAAGGAALSLGTTGGTADMLQLGIDGNIFQRNSAGAAVSLSGETLSATTNSILVNSFAGNTVLGGTGGGILFNNVHFSGAAGGTLTVGTTGTRVQGDGLSLVNPIGTLNFTTLNVANNAGTGILVDTKGAGTTFSLNNTGGAVDTTGGTALNLDPLSVGITFSSVTAGGGASGIIFDGVAGTFSVTGATGITGTTGAGISAINTNTGTFNFNTITVNNAASAGGGIGWASGTLNVGGLADIDTTSGAGISQTGGTTGFTGGLGITTTSGSGFSASGGGTVSVTGASNTIASNGGTALNLSGVTVGTGGVNFSSVSASNTAVGMALANVASSGGGAIALGTVNLQGINLRGVVVSGTLGAALSFNDLDIGLNSTTGTAFDLNGATLGAAITANDFDVTNAAAAGTSVGVDLRGATGGQTVRLGDTNPAGNNSSIAGVNTGVFLNSTTSLAFTFGDGNTADQLSTISADVGIDASSAPVAGTYNFQDVNFQSSPGLGFGLGKIYFVGATATGDGSGKDQNNLATLADAEFNAAASDIIVLVNDQGVITAQGTNGNDTLVLLANEQLRGFDNGNINLALTVPPTIQLASSTLSIADQTPGGTTTLTTTDGSTVITLGASGNIIDGFTINGNDGTGVNAAIGISGSGTANATIRNMTIQNFTAADIDFGTGATGTTTLTNLTLSAGAATTAIKFGAATGTVTATNVDTTGGSGLSVVGGNAAFSFDSTSSTSSVAATAVSITNRTGGSFSYAGSITTGVSASGIVISGATGINTVSFTGAVNHNATGAAVSINNGGLASTVSFANLIISTGGPNTAFTATNGGTVNVTTGSISTGASQAVNLNGIAAGINFTSTSAGGGTNNVALTNVTGTVSLGSGALSGSASGNAAFLISGGTADVSYAGSITKTVSGAAVSIASRTAGTVTLSGNINSNANGSAIVVSGNTGGTINFSGASKTVTSLDGMNAVALTSNTGATINFSNGGLAITNTGIGFAATGGGTVSVTGAGNTLSTTGGLAINLSGVTVAAGGVNFASTNTSSASGSAVILNNVTGAGTVNLGTGALVGGNAATIRIGDGAGGANSGGTVAFTYAGTITSGTSRAVDIQDRAAGAGNITLSGDITHNVAGQTGIFLDDNAAGTITFSGASKAITSGTAAGVSLTDNAGATINFTGGGLVISTTSGTGFNATGAGPAATTGGTVNVTGTGNTITSTTGTALNVVNTTIGASNLVFQSISATGSSGNAGIVLDNTGSSGGLTVTGTGSAGTGGTISNKTGADILNGNTATGNNTSGTGGTGIFLRSTANVSLASMQLNDFSNFAIYGKNVTGFTLTGSTISGVNGNNNGGNFEESAIRFDNLLGSASITGSNISGGGYSNIAVWNTSGTLNRLTMSGNTFGLINSSIGNDNIDFTVYNSATANVTLDSNTFSGTRSDFFEAIANNNATMDVVATGNTFHNGQTIIPGGGTAISVRSGSGGNASAATTTFNIANNIATDGGTNAFDTVGIFVAKGQDLGTVTGKITGNQLVGKPGSNSDGIFVRAAGNSGTLTVLIQNNNITGWGNNGIHLQNNDGGATMNASVFGNSVTAPGSAFPFAAFFADNGATAGPPADTSTMNLVLGGSGAQQNTFTGGSINVSLSNFNAGTTFNLSTNGSGSGTVTGVVQDDNVGSPTVDTSGGSGAINLVGTLPPAPP